MTTTYSGTTTSFDNAVQAVDDFVTADEDSIFTFDVMANDLGGKAKILWSIDDTTRDGTAADGDSDDGTVDLFVKDYACVPEYSELGAKIWIENGIVKYDTNALDWLGAGDTAVDHFTYAIRLSNGTLAWATVTVTLTGTNDRPVLTIADATGALAEDSADPTLTDSGALTVTDADASDVVTITTAYNNDAAWSDGTLTAGQLAAITGGFSADSDGWDYSVANAALQFLAAGETITLSFTVTATDDSGTATNSDSEVVTITLTGTNDAPLIAASAAGYDVAGSASELGDNAAGENATLHSTSGLITFSDVDATDSHTASFAPAAAGYLGTFALADADPSAPGTQTGAGSLGWSFTVADGVLDSLAAGQVLTQTYNVTVSDGNGGTLVQAVTITLTGTNDAPLIAASAAGYDVAGSASELGDNAAGENATLHSTSGLITFSDVDATDSHTASFAPAAAGYLGTFALADADPSAPGTQTGAGSLGWSFTVADGVLDSLAAGQVLTQTYNVTVSDGNGGTLVQAVTITLTGTNDAPLIAASAAGYDVAGSASELGDNAAGENATLHSTSGLITFSDVDATDSHTASFAPAAAGYLGTFALADADPSAPGTQTGAGSLGWSFTVADGVLDSLAAGQVLTQTYNVTVSDGNGGTLVQAVTITLTGTNDAPLIAASAAGYDVAGSASELGDNAAGENATLHSTSGLITFSDVDATDSHTASFAPAAAGYLGTFALADADPSAPGTQTGAGSLGWSFTVADGVLDSLAAGQVLTQTYNVTVSDGNGGTLVQAVTITLTGTNDGPVVAAGDVTGGATELGAPAGNLTDNGTIAFSDVDLADVHSVGAVTASAGALGTLTASVSTDTTGSGTGGVIGWSYSVAASAVEYLAAGQTKVETFTFSLSDGQGGSVERTVSVTLTGTNDAAVITGATSGTVTEDAVPNTVGGNLDSTDVDGVADSWTAVTTATASANGYGTFVIDAMGNWTYTLDNSNATVNALNTASAPLTDSFTVTTADGTSQMVTVTINGRTDGIVVAPVDAGNDDPNNFDTKSDQAPGNTLITGTAGDDTSLNGGKDAETILGLDGNDTVNAGGGGDTVYGGSGVDTISGGDGNDAIYGQAGNDILHGDGGNDAVYGGSGDDQIFGDANNDQSLYGGSGNDTISGGANADDLFGGFGADILNGGDGNDRFVFLSTRDTGDTIQDFQSGDKIDFSAIDANGAAAGDLAFVWGGTTATAHGVWYATSGGNAIVYMDTDGDASTAELAITLTGVTTLGSPDFIF